MSHARRSLVVVAVVALGASMATAFTPAAAAPMGSTSITVFLKAPNAAALDRLATARGLTHAQRLRAVNALVPSEATHQQVANTLRSQGYRVTSETSWSLTATGSRARTAALFGTRPTLGKHPTAADFAAATGPLSRVPASIAPFATAVFPTTGGPAAYKHATATSSLNGTDFRNADTPATVAPSTGNNTTGATIATLQLADFRSSPVSSSHADSVTAADLTSYANSQDIPDPVTLPAGDPRYKAIFVDGGPATADDSLVVGGDEEVDLDQESILSTAPTANQHAYFAPNTPAGFNDVFANVYDDVVGNSHATAADPHIVALSSSWGDCESRTSRASINALEPILKSLVAAGVTVFSAAGDDGIYDCGSNSGTGTDNSTAGVDYPGSSPSVISVGGTNLSAAAGTAPNTGTNWVEKTWTCTDPISCQSTDGTGGSGGGASAKFAAPAYQQVGIDDAPFAGNAKRLVPDIAADGDPASGFVIYSSNPDALPSHQIEFGGTSLASPISAAQLANALADKGRKTGVGDIHGALYSAYRQTRSLAPTNKLRPFRDVTVGTNGATANKGSDPSVKAQAGYDTNSGVGGVLWSALVPYLLDTHKPRVSAALSEPSQRTSKWRQLRVKWQVTRGTDSSLLAPTVVKLTANGKALATSTSLVARGSKTFVVPAGRTYALTVTGTDLSGRKTVKTTHSVQVPVDDSKFTFSNGSKGWQRVTNAHDFGGSHATTAKKGATARASGTGRVFKVRVLAGRAGGKLGIYLGHTLVKKVNLHAPSAKRESITLLTLAKPHHRTFTFKALKNAPVSLDALDVTY